MGGCVGLADVIRPPPSRRASSAASLFASEARSTPSAWSPNQLNLSDRGCLADQYRHRRRQRRGHRLPGAAEGGGSRNRGLPDQYKRGSGLGGGVDHAFGERVVDEQLRLGVKAGVKTGCLDLGEVPIARFGLLARAGEEAVDHATVGSSDPCPRLRTRVEPGRHRQG